MNSSIALAFGPLRYVAFAMLSLLPLALLAAEPVRRSFDIPAGDAEKTLRRFALQSALQVAFPPDSVRGVRTNEVKGELTARAALRVMTKGTQLVVVEDAATGALSVRHDAKVKDEKRDLRSPDPTQTTPGRQVSRH